MLVGCCVVWKFVGVFLVCAVCVFSLLFLSAFRLAGDLVDVCARGREVGDKALGHDDSVWIQSSVGNFGNLGRLWIPFGVLGLGMKKNR